MMILFSGRASFLDEENGYVKGGCSMLEQRFRWKNKQIRQHVAVLDGEKSPTILIKNATYLNHLFSKWLTANIWIYHDRIVYVGEQLPACTEHCEVIDGEGTFLVPGYMEPHSHPFQLYNPQTLAQHAAKFGTTTLVNDNLVHFLLEDNHAAFSLVRDLQHIPTTMYWWGRFDAQTELAREEKVFSNHHVMEWIKHDQVIQGGELTGWPRLLEGDNLMLQWIQETKRKGKKVEGHFPGASEKTLAKMMLFGVDCDHEAMTGEEVHKRLLQGYMVSLRHSSIRPDLPRLLDDIKEMGLTAYDKMFFTTDGATPRFYEQGVMNQLIQIALEKGVPTADAYHMASVNVARYYNLEHLLGNIATGRVANINFLQHPTDPTPISVLAKGKWVVKDGIEQKDTYPALEWDKYGLQPLALNWDLTADDLQFSMPFGIQMVNEVITKPYSLTSTISRNKLETTEDECFLLLIDRHGKWRVNTFLKGFASDLEGLASSYSNTGDILVIGKDKQAMVTAFNRMKEVGGGIVLAQADRVIHEIPLTLNGMMSSERVDELIHLEKILFQLLKKRGYPFSDPIYSLLFLQSTHLPYVRVTQTGIYDVMKKTILFPAVMR